MLYVVPALFVAALAAAVVIYELEAHDHPDKFATISRLIWFISQRYPPFRFVVSFLLVMGCYLLWEHFIFELS